MPLSMMALRERFIQHPLLPQAGRFDEVMTIVDELNGLLEQRTGKVTLFVIDDLDRIRSRPDPITSFGRSRPARTARDHERDAFEAALTETKVEAGSPGVGRGGSRGPQKLFGGASKGGSENPERCFEGGRGGPARTPRVVWGWVRRGSRDKTSRSDRLQPDRRAKTSLSDPVATRSPYEHLAVGPGRNRIAERTPPCQTRSQPDRPTKTSLRPIAAGRRRTLPTAAREKRGHGGEFDDRCEPSPPQTSPRRAPVAKVGNDDRGQAAETEVRRCLSRQGLSSHGRAATSGSANPTTTNTRSRRSSVLITKTKKEGTRRSPPSHSQSPAYPPKSSNMTFSGSTPSCSAMLMTAVFIMGGPQM